MFSKNFINLEAQTGGVGYFKDKLEAKDLCIVSPDAGGVKRAKEFLKNIEKA